jgi:DNA-binding response OmpR family regulator
MNSQTQQDALTISFEAMPLQKNALLIEDNPLILHLHSRYLLELGFSVDIANTQEEALKYAFRQHYDVIVTDLGLVDSRNETIITSLREISSLNCKTPLIVVTATNSPALKARCLNAGANGFIVKPLKKEVLKAILHKSLGDKSTFS